MHRIVPSLVARRIPLVILALGFALFTVASTSAARLRHCPHASFPQNKARSASECIPADAAPFTPIPTRTRPPNTSPKRQRVNLLCYSRRTYRHARVCNPRPSHAQVRDLQQATVPTPVAARPLPLSQRRGEFRLEARGVEPILYHYVMDSWGHEPDDEAFDLALADKLPPVQEKPDLKPSWQLYIPPTYEPSTPHGVLVFINSTESGNVPAAWKAVLNKHHLLWASANNSGNDHKPEWRHALATEGLSQVEEHFQIDFDRIYIAGFGDGGRIASIVMLKDAEFITGGFPQNIARSASECIPADAAPFTPITTQTRSPNTSPKRQRVNPLCSPAGKISHLLTASDTLACASCYFYSRQNRYVFLTGENDAHRDQMQGTFVQYQSDAFRNVTYLQVPGLGQALPTADWFERGLISLDAPLALQAPAAFTQAQSYEKLNNLGDATDNYRRAFLHGGAQSFVPEARQKYLTLQQQYQHELATLKAKLATQDLDSLKDEIAEFRRRWGEGAEGDVVGEDIEKMEG